MTATELEARHRAAAVAARMFLICCRSMLACYNRNKNIAAMMPEMLVVLAIRINDNRRMPPIAVKRISKLIGLPRENVRRALANLVEHGVVKMSGHGYVGNEGYVKSRLHSRNFQHIVAAIRAAANELRDYSLLPILGYSGWFAKNFFPFIDGCGI